MAFGPLARAVCGERISTTPRMAQARTRSGVAIYGMSLVGEDVCRYTELGMRTTISIDEELVAELMRAEPDVSRSEALRRAVKSHLRRKRVDAFMKLAGSRLVDLDWREMERIDMEDAERRSHEPHGRRRSRTR